MKPKLTPRDLTSAAPTQNKPFGEGFSNGLFYRDSKSNKPEQPGGQSDCSVSFSRIGPFVSIL